MSVQNFVYLLFRSCLPVCFLTLWIGCGTTGSIPEVEVDPRNPHAHKINVPKKYLSVQDVKVRTNEASGLFEVNITLYNKKGPDTGYRYEFFWLDKDGFTIRGADSGWRRIPRPPSGPFEFKRTTVNARVRDFKLTMDKE